MAKEFGELNAEKASQRQQAYLKLIIELLNCRRVSTSGVEFQEVLNGYPELVTPELLEVMAQEAESLRDNKNWDKANSLLSLALQVGEVLGSSEIEGVVRQDTADVLSQMGRREYEVSQFSEAVQFSELSLTIYRELSDCQGEVEALNSLGKGFRCLGEKERAIALHRESLAIAREIGYSQGEVDALNGLGAVDNSLGKYEEAKGYHQEALSMAEAMGYAKGKADAFNGLGNVCRDIGEYEEAIAYDQKSLAIRQEIRERWGECVSFINLTFNYWFLEQYEQSLEWAQKFLVAAREIKNRQWEAHSLFQLGNTYCVRIKGETAENLELAIAAYENALEVYTKEVFPNDWADTQNHLGNAYRERIKGETAENLELAIAAYENALEVYTKEVFPNDWADTQNNLGTAYSKRIKGDTAENLKLAIAAYKNALEVRSKETFPNDWAMIQNNLGTAYFDRIKGNTAENLELAITAYKNALEVRSKETFLNDWADTQNNLGTAYSKRIKGDTAENLKLAIAAYKNALEVRSKETFPNDWAMIQNNLGTAYFDRIKGDKAENLELAIAALQNALKVRTKEAFSNEWAVTEDNLGTAYCMRIKGDTAENLELAIAAFKNALEVRTKDTFPKDWAMTQNNLGTAYFDRIKGDKAENLELAIAAYKNALEICTKDTFPKDWVMIHNNLGAAYGYRIKGDRAENLELAILAYQNSLEVCTKEAFPNDWADTHNNLGVAYADRIKGDKAENLELSIAGYENSLEIYTPKANPAECLGTARSLGNLHFKESNWQSAIDAYKQAITAVELSRSWSQDDDRRQEILQEAIGVYDKIVQCFVNLQQYSQAFAYAERSRSRQLVDIMASKDVYRRGEIPPEVEKLLQQFESLERQIDRLRFPKESQNNREATDAATATRQRAALGAKNEAVAKLESEKQEVNRQIRKLDRVLAESIQVAPLEFEQLQQLIEDDTTAILSFYSTDYDTYAFIVRRGGVNVHSCQGQGRRELQIWLFDHWLKPYVTTDDWHQQMLSKLPEISQRLQLDKLVEKLDGIQELILIPHLYLHQIPFAPLPLADNQYFGDKFLIRTQASCQVLDFCYRRPPLASNPPTYGIVENTTQDLPCSTYEGRQVAEMYQVADSKYLQGSQGTVNEYKKLLPQVQRLLSTHHAQSRLDNNLESALILADGRITLGQLLSPAFRFPDLDEVFLSCCETNIGSTDVSDNMMTLNTGFLCAGARGVVSTLWSVDDLATSIFSIFYHQLRQAGKNRPQALQLAQQKLRELTGKEFEEKYGKELEQSLRKKLKEAREQLREAKKQRNCHPKDSLEYEELQKERVKQAKIYDRIGTTIENLKQKSQEECPFAHPIYWSGFICAGLRG